jgi:hypothetical protein
MACQLVVVCRLEFGMLELVTVILKIDARLRSLRQPDLAKQLRPYRPGLLVEGAQDWLGHQT